MDNITIISREKFDAMLDEEKQTGREYIEYGGQRESYDGFLYGIYEDTRTGKVYAVPTIRTVHMGFNSNDDGMVDVFIATVEQEGAAKASWGVTGRTAHLMLAQKLKAELPQFEFELDYDSYLCLAKKKLPELVPMPGSERLSELKAEYSN